MTDKTDRFIPCACARGNYIFIRQAGLDIPLLTQSSDSKSNAPWSVSCAVVGKNTESVRGGSCQPTDRIDIS